MQSLRGRDPFCISQSHVDTPNKTQSDKGKVNRFFSLILHDPIAFKPKIQRLGRLSTFIVRFRIDVTVPQCTGWEGDPARSICF